MAGFRLGSSKNSSWSIARKRFQNGLTDLDKRKQLAIRRAALMTERELKLALRKGEAGGKPFAPLSPMTVLLRKRRSKKPLLDTGSLLGSITTTFNARKNAAFVGVHRSSKTADGDSLFNVAVAQEFGTPPFVIRITPAMRKFFIRLSIITRGRIKPLSRARRTLLHPGIPARPFVRPTVEAIGPKLQTSIASVLATVKTTGGSIL